MIPNKTRAQRLDDRLRVLGFHARASGIYHAAASKPAGSPETNTHLAVGGLSGKGGEAGAAGRRGGSASSARRPLTQEEKQMPMAKMVEACKKRRPGSAATGGDGGTGQR